MLKRCTACDYRLCNLMHGGLFAWWVLTAAAGGFILARWWLG